MRTFKLDIARANVLEIYPRAADKGMPDSHDVGETILKAVADFLVPKVDGLLRKIRRLVKPGRTKVQKERWLHDRHLQDAMFIVKGEQCWNTEATNVFDTELLQPQVGIAFPDVSAVLRVNLHCGGTRRFINGTFPAGAQAPNWADPVLRAKGGQWIWHATNLSVAGFGVQRRWHELTGTVDC